MKRRIYEKEKYSDQFSALLLVAAGIWYYVSLPAFNIHSSGVWYFVLVLVLAVGLVFAGKKGLRYGAIDLKEMKESKGFKWCVRLFIFC